MTAEKNIRVKTLKVLIAGDIVGSAGRKALAVVGAGMKNRGEVDIVVANAENAAGGKGVTRKIAQEVFDNGADVITLGDHTWDQKEAADLLESERRIIRPANFAPGCPGKGWTRFEFKGVPVFVINLVGRVFMRPSDCPFRTADAVLDEAGCEGQVVLVDFHAEATSEKIALGRYLDGRVSCVCGTHTHVQTSDEAILPKGTAYITDIGMTGGKDSVIGRDLASVSSMFMTGMPAAFKTAKKGAALEGIILEVDCVTGRGLAIKRVREPIDGDRAS